MKNHKDLFVNYCEQIICTVFIQSFLSETYTENNITMMYIYK